MLHFNISCNESLIADIVSRSAKKQTEIVVLEKEQKDTIKSDKQKLVWYVFLLTLTSAEIIEKH